jgi:predicted RNA-binding protein associated with RNAse of E/G family
VVDRYIDFIVPARASPYRVLDLEELADALSDGNISTAAAAKALRAAQAFVDTYLHRIGQRQGASWKDFPPASDRSTTDRRL